MIDSVLRRGDEVLVAIPEELRRAGFSPCPDGLATIVGFREMAYGRTGNDGLKPGIYANSSLPHIRSQASGRVLELGAHFLELADQVEYRRRVATLRSDDWMDREFLCDLPRTTLWEDDRVRLWLANIGSVYGTIERVQYLDIGRRRDDGSPVGIYDVKVTSGANFVYCREEDITLLERGPVWKYYHGVPLIFASISEEATFFHRLGHTDEVPNAAGSYYWGRDELLAAVRDGIADAGRSDAGFLLVRPINSAIRFRDRELGRRVAQVTLESHRAVMA